MLLRMPGQSLFASCINEEMSWGPQEYLTARLVDSLEVSNWMFLKANSGEGATDIPFPESVPRPGEFEEAQHEASAPEMTPAAAIAAFFANPFQI
ncbi:hypothetical protein [Streptomyces sp. CBMA123]|uniref:hypothetical protein n=1 Tax=Streptomyces sp. CBMA123 TaxID=1896313 RepID=UPI0016618A34|nr:hypothetical protein [Streptomyces sp. CBMA123]